MAPDYVDHTYQLQSRDMATQPITLRYKAVPDWHTAIDDIIAEGDKVRVRHQGTGIHTGEYQGIAPTGKTVTGTSIVIYRLIEGKIVERWSVVGMVDFYKQLGLVDYTEQGKNLFPQA